MKLATSDREIERFLPNTEKKFSIRASGRAFRILSNALYKDKILAIVRELSCNAYDSHVAAGHAERPFHVHLPNALEPFFAVRDEGTGLSPDDIETIYTTYFQSTKADSNDFIGALGLGSKSPFSYVDSFTVRTRFAGMQYDYAAFISEEGEPKIARMSEMPTLEANGLEVSMPVKHASDYAVFAEKATLILSRFNPRPNVTGRAEFRFNDGKIILQGDGWRLTTNTDRYSAKSDAVMGSVAYPIVKNSIQTLNKTAQRIYACAGLEVDFPIGALDVTAGREDISYDRPTLQALEDRASQVRDNARQVIQARFDACQTEYDAKILYSQLFFYGAAGFALLGDEHITFRGQPLNSASVAITFTEADTVTVSVYNNPAKRYYKRRYGAGHDAILSIGAEASARIIVDDTHGKRGSLSRILECRKNKPNETVYLVQGSESGIASFLQKLDGFPTENLSDLAAPPSKRNATPSVPRPMMQLSYYAWRGYSVRRNDYKRYWDKSNQFDPTAGGYYVRRKNSLILDDAGNQDHRLPHMLEIAARVGLLNQETAIYGFDANALKTIVPQGAWVDLRAALKVKIQEKISQDHVVHRRQINALYYAHDYLRDKHSLLDQVVSKLPADHPMVTFLSAMNAARGYATRSASNDSDMNALADYAGVTQTTDSDQVDQLVNQWETILEKYPLLQVFKARHTSNIDDLHLLAYIQFCDWIAAS